MGDNGPDDAILNLSAECPSQLDWTNTMIEYYDAVEDAWFPMDVSGFHGVYLDVIRTGPNDLALGTPWRVLTAPIDYIVPASGVIIP